MTSATGKPLRMSPDRMREQIKQFVDLQLGPFLPHPTAEDVGQVVEASMGMLYHLKTNWPEGWHEADMLEAVRHRVAYEVGKEVAEPAVMATPEGRENTQWKEWLNPDGSRLSTGEAIDWRFWARYREHFGNRLKAGLLKQNQPEDVVEVAVDAVVAGLEVSTERALARLIDPAQEGEWLCKGLVMGNVQSGKTGHYAGLINRAVDAGYKIIIVLAGQTVDLRKQTQERLDSDFGGHGTTPDNDEPIGVGTIDIGVPLPAPRPWTHATPRGDLKRAVELSLRTALDLSGEAPHYLVIKKNPTALRMATAILSSVLPRFHAQDYPALVIDDECDQASIDIKSGSILDHDKAVDSISTINREIRKLLGCFRRRAYVGYTATPFANVFIWPEAFQEKIGADLFPDDFILSLDPPKNYMGPSQVFGPVVGAHVSGTDNGMWGVVRPASVPDEFIQAMKKPGRPWSVPSSLRKAILSFVLATAIRHWRKQDVPHAGMLIQATQRKDVHREIEGAIDPIVQELKHGLRDGVGSETYEELRAWYEEDVRSSPAAKEWGHAYPSNFSELLPHLRQVLNELEPCVINSDSEAVLHYQTKTKPTIIIGGDKLSRGFTIEGLLVTYFARTTTFGDTLLQMGRWFGYRDGHQDLVRIFAPQDQIDMFQSITESSEELRSTFKSFSKLPEFTPRDWSPRVLYNKLTPKLKPTSRSKMGNTRLIPASYAGEREQTVAFDCRRFVLERNWTHTKRWFNELGEPTEVRKDGTAYWEGIGPSAITLFIEKLDVSKEHLNLDKANILSFLLNHPMEFPGEYQDWTVILPGLLDDDNRQVELAGGKHGLAVRNITDDNDTRVLPDGHTMRLQAMGGSDDVVRGLRPDERKAYEAAMGSKPKNATADKWHATEALGPSRGVLMVYLVDTAPWGLGEGLDPAVGWMLLFGNSQSASRKHYIKSIYNPGGQSE